MFTRMAARSDIGVAFFGTIILTCTTQLSADHFTYRDDAGNTLSVEGVAIGAKGQWQAIQQSDGQIVIAHKGAIRKTGPDIRPATGEEVTRQLAEQIGEDRFRSHYEQPYLVGIVLMAPLTGEDEKRVKHALGEAVDFMHGVERGFNAFVERVKLETTEPEYPLVMLIFESERDFEEYAAKISGNAGLSAGILSGFYSGRTNRLYVRMSECLSFEVPLHEAIHQQVYNRGLFNRLAPIPSWFNEGIATAFEAERGRISTGPFRVHSKYVWRAQSAGGFSWAEVVENDRAFHGDIFAATAYTHAWCMHWLLVNKHTGAYADYVRLLGEKPTMGRSTQEERNSDFQQTFGKSIEAMQMEFPRAITAAIKRRGIRFPKAREPGYMKTESHLAQIELYQNRKTLRRSGRIEFTGKLKNISPIRAMSFYIALYRADGSYTDWYIEELGSRKRLALRSQKIEKQLPRSLGGRKRTTYLYVRSAIPGSAAANRWKEGNLPIPGTRAGG